MIEDQERINMASMSFLDFNNHPEVKKVAKEAVWKYGVGSCGPRGFYGTFGELLFDRIYLNF